MNKDTKENIAIIKQLRLDHGLTQHQLAEYFNVSLDLVRSMEQGRRSLTVEMLINYSEFFNVSIGYLVYGKDSNVSIRKSIKAIREQLDFLEKNI